MSSGGRHNSPRTGTKVSYPTREAAVIAGTRRRTEGWDVRVYECTDRRGRLPDIPWPHWHLGGVRKRAWSGNDGYRFFEEWNDLVGVRVVGNWLAENGPKGLTRVIQRLERASR